MGYGGSQFKIKGRIKFGFLSTAVTLGVWFQFMFHPLASPSATDESKREPTTSTVRSWPSHDFFLEVISASANSSKTDSGDSVDLSQKETTPILDESFRGFPVNESHRQPVPDNSSLVLENRTFSTASDVPPSALVETGIPLLVFDPRTNPLGSRLRSQESFDVGWSLSPWLDGTPQRNQNPPALRNPFQKLDKMNSIISTAPSIPLYTTGGADPKSHPNSAQRKPQGTRFRPVDKNIRPVASVKPPTAYPPIGELDITKETSTVREIVRAVPTPQSELLFKLWSYSDDGFQLEAQKGAPLELLSGYNVTNGQVLNIDHIPLPIRKVVASAFNLNSSVIKRHSGPGSIDAFHWQQLPSLITPTLSTPHPSLVQSRFPPNLQNQLALHYVIWSTTPPPPPPPQPSSPSVLEMFQHLFPLESPVRTPHQMNNQPTNFYHPTQQVTISPQFAHENKVKEAEILANVASMALIMSKINKNLGNFQESVNTNENLGNISPQLSQSLLPLYLQYLKHGQSGVSGDTLKQSSPTPSTPLFRRGTENIHSSVADDYSFYPSQKYRVPFGETSPGYGDSYKKRFLFKNIKKKLKKIKKKKRKRNKESNYSLLDPGNFKFNYVFGMDVLGTIQRIFYTILAFKAAPLIILTILAIASLGLLVFPKLLNGAKLASVLWQLFHPHPPKTVHHYYPSHSYKTHRPHHHHRPQYHYQGWSKYRRAEHAHPPDPTMEENPASNIGSLVQLSYGDPIDHRSGDGKEFQNPGEATTAYALYDTELDTMHNRKVMEILMNTKNSTLLKLLESWELNSPSASKSTLPEPGKTTDAADRRRRKRKKRYVSRGLGRVLQIPASTNVT